MKTMEIKVADCRKVGNNYECALTLTSPVAYPVGTTIGKIPVGKARPLDRQRILQGIKRVFGFTQYELLYGCADMEHTYARKVYTKLRLEMGVTVGCIARELNKHTASVSYFKKDNSIKLQEYIEAVRNV